MSDSVDYKKKYQDLRGRFINSMDSAFRMGYEKGSGDAQMQQMQQQQAQQAQMQQQMQQAQMQGQDPGMAQDPNAQDPNAQDPNAQQAQGAQQQPGSQEELDQYISELEGLVNKSEIKSDDLKKSLEKIKTFQMMSKIKFKPMAKSNSFAPQAAANLTGNAKRELSLQQKIIDDIMTKWEQEAPKSIGEAMQVLGTEALTKKE